MMKDKKCNFIYLIVLLFVGVTGIVMGGCQKDYDGQLEIIRNQIKSGEISLDNLYSKVALIEKQIVELQHALENQETSEEHKKDIQVVLDKLAGMKTELKGNLSELERKIADNGQELLDLKESIEDLEEQFNVKLTDVSKSIQMIDTSLDLLDGRIGKLEEQLESLREKQSVVEDAIDKLKEQLEKVTSQEDIDKINDALAVLQTTDKSLQGGIDKLQNNLSSIKIDLEGQIGVVDDKIENAAKDIVNLQRLFDDIVNDKNLATLDDLNKAIADAMTVIDKKYATFNDELISLRNDYNTQLKQLNELLKSIEDVEHLNEMIETVQTSLGELNSTMNTHLEKYLQTQSLVGALDNQVKELKATVDAHTAAIVSINTTIDQIKADIKKLFDRIQSMVIIPKYSGNYVKMSQVGSGKYELTMELDIRPYNIAQKFTPNMFSIVVKPVEQTPTRAAVLPVFSDLQIEENTSSGTVTVKATSTGIAGVSDITNSFPMNFQVALSLKDVVSSNDRLTPFVGVYYVAANSFDEDIEYSFYDDGNEISNIKYDNNYSLSNFAESDCIAKTVLDGDGKLLSSSSLIFGSMYAINPNISVQYTTVEYDLLSCGKGNSATSSWDKFIRVTSDGYIQKVNELDPGVQLRGLKLVVALQVTVNGAKYGKRGYFCIILQ